MKSLICYLFTGLGFILVSCERSASESSSAATEIFTINSGKSNGFSFLQQSVSMDDPDFLIIPQKVITGDILSPFLSDPNLENRFYLVSEFNDQRSAQTCFDSEFIRLPEKGSLQQFATDLKPNQVWIVRTRFGEYGKILILDSYGNRSSEAPFARLKFRAALIG